MFPNLSTRAVADLAVKNYDGIPYISGGFGIDEREKLYRMAKEDDLELSFALSNKEYLGRADVVIKDAQGQEVLKTISDGPLFFAKLPEGNYTVEATAMGKTLKQKAHISPGRPSKLYFAWKEPDQKARA